MDGHTRFSAAERKAFGDLLSLIDKPMHLIVDVLLAIGRDPKFQSTVVAYVVMAYIVMACDRPQSQISKAWDTSC